jgi:hypothetical protein
MKPLPHVFKFRLTAPFDQRPKLEMKVSAGGKMILDEWKTVDNISTGLLEISNMSALLVDKFNEFHGTPGSKASDN